MPSKSKLSEYSYSARAEFDRCQACFRAAQSCLLITLVFAFLLFLLILGMDICKVQTDNTVLFGLIIVLDLIALIALGVGVRGVALEKRLLVLLYAVTFFLLIIVHSILFTYRHRGLSIFTLIIDVFITLAGILFISIYCWFHKVKPSDYKQLRLEAQTRALTEGEEKDELA